MPKCGFSWAECARFDICAGKGLYGKFQDLKIRENFRPRIGRFGQTANFFNREHILFYNNQAHGFSVWENSLETDSFPLRFTSTLNETNRARE